MNKYNTICSKINTNLLHTNSLHTILHKFGHIKIRICIQDTHCTIPICVHKKTAEKIYLSLKKLVPIDPQVCRNRLNQYSKEYKIHAKHMDKLYNLY
jgi:hypothetical protein